MTKEEVALINELIGPLVAAQREANRLCVGEITKNGVVLTLFDKDRKLRRISVSMVRKEDK